MAKKILFIFQWCFASKNSDSLRIKQQHSLFPFHRAPQSFWMDSVKLRQQIKAVSRQACFSSLAVRIRAAFALQEICKLALRQRPVSAEQLQVVRDLAIELRLIQKLYASSFLLTKGREQITVRAFHTSHIINSLLFLLYHYLVITIPHFCDIINL